MVSMAPMIRRLRRAAARAAIRVLYWLGWAACLIMAVPLPFSPAKAAQELRFEGLKGPPPGHPERVVPGGLTEAEQSLWSSLGVFPE